MQERALPAADLSAASPAGPRGAHLDMVGAVLAGDGLERVAEIATAHVGAPVAVIVPSLGRAPAVWAPYERYVAASIGARRPERPPEVAAEVPITSGGRPLGAVLLLGPAARDPAEYLHVAAIAALTEVAVSEARDETEQMLRGSLLEDVLARPDVEPANLARRAARLGVELDAGYTALCADPGARTAGRLIAALSAEAPEGLFEMLDGRVFGLLPLAPDDAHRVAARAGRQALVGLSSHHRGAGEVRGALDEAELVLRATAAGASPGQEIGGGTYRLLFRVLASHPDEVRSFYEDTVAPLVRYDEQYATDLLGTVAAYLDHDCNMNATAHAIHAHRHTVAYRLERVRDLTGLDPGRSEDRERLGLGLKAHRIIAPGLPR